MLPDIACEVDRTWLGQTGRNGRPQYVDADSCIKILVSVSVSPVPEPSFPSWRTVTQILIKIRSARIEQRSKSPEARDQDSLDPLRATSEDWEQCDRRTQYLAQMR